MKLALPPFHPHSTFPRPVPSCPVSSSSAKLLTQHIHSLSFLYDCFFPVLFLLISHHFSSSSNPFPSRPVSSSSAKLLTVPFQPRPVPHRPGIADGNVIPGASHDPLLLSSLPCSRPNLSRQFLSAASLGNLVRSSAWSPCLRH
ncbi:hypothetical protein E2C01_028728 [Portunus trituberculatus]|uniref:Uncharacterized protein n=1 Tax=Portunus trituberculatus TaxID=210409 RepID=A0A5B7EPZ8_PORTR|nr:hypothetical protein [Portunus trituberculatus]